VKKNEAILIIFGMNIPDTTFYQKTLQCPNYFDACSCTTCQKRNKQNAC